MLRHSRLKFNMNLLKKLHAIIQIEIWRFKFVHFIRVFRDVAATLGLKVKGPKSIVLGAGVKSTQPA